MVALEMLQRSRVHPHQRVNLISVVMDDNLDEIEPLVKLAKQLKVIITIENVGNRFLLTQQNLDGVVACRFFSASAAGSLGASTARSGRGIRELVAAVEAMANTKTTRMDRRYLPRYWISFAIVVFLDGFLF